MVLLFLSILFLLVFHKRAPRLRALLLTLGAMHYTDVGHCVDLHDVRLAKVHASVELRGSMLLLLDLCLDL